MKNADSKKMMKKFTIREVETLKPTSADYPPFWCAIEVFRSWLSG